LHICGTIFKQAEGNIGTSDSSWFHELSKGENISKRRENKGKDA
jgi:hypothetical protein